MSNILVIDDAEDILLLIKRALEKDGHVVTTLINSSKLQSHNINFYDMILLDIMMPFIDGYEALKTIRISTDCPIIFLTAKNTEIEILYGLSLGADDYLTKPFRLSELRARINAHLRRETRERKSCLNLGKYRFHLSQKRLYYRDELIHLTKGEYEICEFLARNHGCVYSKERIYETVFGYDAVGDSQSISTHIKNIRCKVESKDSPVKTRWGVGYLWEVIKSTH